MRGHQALAEAMAAEEVEVVFGLLGDGNMLFVSDLSQVGIRFVGFRHEAGAVTAADAYARATGQPGIVTVTHGPGLTQIGTPLTAARLARSGVIVIAGDTAAKARLHTQNIDQSPFAIATAGAERTVRAAETLDEDVRLAFRHVRLKRGPIVLQVPVDIQESEVPNRSYAVSARTLVEEQRRYPDPSKLQALVDAITGSKRPIIVAGRGAVDAEAQQRLTELADKRDALLSTTLPVAGWFDGHPRNLGICGGFAHPNARSTFQQADLIVGMGASLTQFTTDHGRLFSASATIAQVDTDPGAIGDPTVVDLAVLGDVGIVVEELNGSLDPVPPSWNPPSSLSPEDRWPATEWATERNGLDPRAVTLTLNRKLPSDRALVVGIGHYSGWSSIGIKVPHPADRLLPWELGAVGLGLPAGIGLALARPGKTVVVVEGDGGVMMSLPELDTVGREELPILLAVFDDGGYGAEIHQLDLRGRDSSIASFPTPDLAAIAHELGWWGHRPTTLDHLVSTLEEAAGMGGPRLLQIPVTTAVRDDAIFSAMTP